MRARRRGREKQNWWRRIDIPGLLGCAALIFGTYALFWYYAATVRGEVEPIRLMPELSAPAHWLGPLPRDHL